MLQELNIKNAALIKSTNIEFNKGLNVLSGETGAGKSMVIGSLMFALGSRVSRDFIRAGEEKAAVEAVFTKLPIAAKNYAENAGIDCSDGVFIFSRTINRDGRTTARVNGTSVTASVLKELSLKLVDIHSQHEHHSLLNPARHIDILDKFCSSEIEVYKEKLSGLIIKYKNIAHKLKAVSGNNEERKRRIEFLEYKIHEIDDAGLKSNEEEELNKRKKVLSVSEKLINQSRKCLDLLYYGNGNDISACDKISNAVGICNLMAESDKSLIQTSESLGIAYENLRESAETIKNYLENISADPDEINKIENRLDIIYTFKKKYGSTVEEILKSRDEAQKELEFIQNSSQIRLELKTEQSSVMNSIKEICRHISEIRVRTAENLQKRVTAEIQELEMKNAVFKIDISKKDTFNSNGWDHVEFMIATNAGDGLKPLAKTASGGELSRVMIGLKTVISGVEGTGTFIFDEIDVGISGKTAAKVAEKMASISNNQQILYITHLPQIAAMADENLLIEKNVVNESTVTTVKNLKKEEKTKEVLRLMGSNETLAGTKAAEEMIEFCKNIKKVVRKNNI